MQETLNSKKKGDAAFRHKDAKAAIECYTLVGNSQSSLIGSVATGYTFNHLTWV